MINNRRTQRRTTFPFLMLPLHIQVEIFKFCIQSNPSIQFVLAKVGKPFRDLLRSMSLQTPRIYIRSDIGLDTGNRNPVSVRFLLTRAGRNSGLISAIKEIIKGPKWANAWLRLRVSGIGWYDIIDVMYRHYRWNIHVYRCLETCYVIFVIDDYVLLPEICCHLLI